MTKIKFDEGIKKLNDLVKKLESENIDIDKAIDYFNEGKELVKNLKDQLVDIEKKVVKIINDNEK